MTDYDELVCLKCEKHLGWILYSAGAGLPICDACFRREDRDANHADTH